MKRFIFATLLTLALLTPALTSRTKAAPKPRFDCAGDCMRDIDPFIIGCVWAGSPWDECSKQAYSNYLDCLVDNGCLN